MQSTHASKKVSPSSIDISLDLSGNSNRRKSTLTSLFVHLIINRILTTHFPYQTDAGATSSSQVGDDDGTS